MTTDTEDDDGEFYAEAIPVSLCAGDVHIPDTDLLARDSGAEGVLAVRVTESLDVEYLDGATRVWLNVAVPPGPQRKSN